MDWNAKVGFGLGFESEKIYEVPCSDGAEAIDQVDEDEPGVDLAGEEEIGVGVEGDLRSQRVQNPRL